MIATFWAVAAAAWAASEEKQAPPATETAPSDPIAEAKRQFEAIRNQRREFLSDAKLKLSIAPPPALAMDPPLTRQPRAASSLDATKADAQNSWLLDAMRQPGKPDGKNRLRGEDEAALITGRGLGKSPDGETASVPRDLRTKEGNAPTFDPLRDYLAVWMSPADYAVLVNPVKDGQETAFATDLSAGLLPLPMFSNRAAPESRIGAADSLSPANLALRENPYLKASRPNVADFGFASGSPAKLSGASSELKPPAPVGARPPEYSDPPKPATLSALPDRLKPADDRKYFPQLKRF